MDQPPRRSRRLPVSVQVAIVGALATILAATIPLIKERFAAPTPSQPVLAASVAPPVTTKASADNSTSTASSKPATDIAHVDASATGKPALNRRAKPVSPSAAVSTLSVPKTSDTVKPPAPPYVLDRLIVHFDNGKEGKFEDTPLKIQVYYQGEIIAEGESRDVHFHHAESNDVPLDIKKRIERSTLPFQLRLQISPKKRDVWQFSPILRFTWRDGEHTAETEQPFSASEMSETRRAIVLP